MVTYIPQVVERRVLLHHLVGDTVAHQVLDVLLQGGGIGVLLVRVSGVDIVA